MSAGTELQVQPGDVLAGKYSVERVLGQGGMGCVLCVRHLLLDERRALKVMLPGLLGGPQAIERFFREARAAARIRSDHVTKVHDVGLLPSGMPYIEMEFLDGSDLAAVLTRHHPLPPAVVVDWLLQVSEALEEAHGMGIVHRDLKPANLFLTKRPNGKHCVKVLDFGIAKTQSPQDASLTSTGTALGSPLYMSPEQMYGARYADARSDIWSLGVILFQLLTGRVPFDADSLTAIALVVASHPPAMPTSIRADLPADLERIILRCLEKKPQARFSTIGELAAALRASQSSVAGGGDLSLARDLSSPGLTQPAMPIITPAPATALLPAGLTPPGTLDSPVSRSMVSSTVGPAPRRGLLVGGAMLALATAVAGVAIAVKVSADKGPSTGVGATATPVASASATVPPPAVEPSRPPPPAPATEVKTVDGPTPPSASMAPPSSAPTTRPVIPSRATRREGPVTLPPLPPPVQRPNGGFGGVD